MNVGLYFGSFNPIHIGHLIVANTVVQQTDLQKVWFVVSPQNPFKKRADLLHPFDRLDLVERAVADNYDLAATDVEFHLPRPSYTIDTLTYLYDKHPQHTFSLVLGADNLASFPRWKNYERILEYYALYVYPRPDAKLSPLADHPKVTWVDAPLLDISATFIRKSVRAGRSVRYLVPAAVVEQIEAKKFFL